MGSGLLLFELLFLEPCWEVGVYCVNLPPWTIRLTLLMGPFYLPVDTIMYAYQRLGLTNVLTTASQVGDVLLIHASLYLLFLSKTESVYSHSVN
jgi:hypothetical protein